MDYRVNSTFADLLLNVLTRRLGVLNPKKKKEKKYGILNLTEIIILA